MSTSMAWRFNEELCATPSDRCAKGGTYRIQSLQPSPAPKANLSYPANHVSYRDTILAPSHQRLTGGVVDDILYSVTHLTSSTIYLHVPPVIPPALILLESSSPLHRLSRWGDSTSFVERKCPSRHPCSTNVAILDPFDIAKEQG